MLRTLLVLVVASMAAPKAAYCLALAYIDPISGSVLLQVAAAAILGALFSAKSFVLRLRTTIRDLWTKLTGP